MDLAGFVETTYFAPVEVASIESMTDGVETALARALSEQGWWLAPDFLSEREVEGLRADLDENSAKLAPAAIGRTSGRQLAPDIRSDETLWLNGAGAAQSAFLARMETLRAALNRELFLGLFDYEAHYARYAPGSFYQRHVDSFRDSGARRVLSTVVYLNRDWRDENGGELLLWDERGRELARVPPRGGAAVFFLSADFPHEVRPATVPRYSIAGWFRQSARRID